MGDTIVLRTFIGIELSRGIAALMVMVCHYAYMVTDERTILNFLWTGVDLFFVISGFVFAKLIISSKVNLGYFFIRRFFRIYPLYFVVLIIYFYLTNSHSDKINYFINHLFFIQTTTSKEEAFFFNPAFWSLPVEAEFYLFIPILAYLMKFKNSLFIIFILSIIVKLCIILQSTPDKIDVYFILGMHLTGILPEFLIGIFLYKFVIFIDSHFKNSRLKLIVFFTVFGFISISLLSIFFISYGDEGLKEYKIFGGFYNFLCAISYSFILFPLSFIDQKSISKYLNNILVTIGTISYPVYLLHNATPKFLNSIELSLNNENLFLFCIILTLLFSVLLHKYIEEPSRIYGRKLSKIFLTKKSSCCDK
jgi:exopolysaccharide production protein ExoZ